MSTWVLLRGLTRETAHWGGFPQALAQALPGARTAMLDLPGNGRRHADTSPWAVRAMAEACRDDLRRQGIAPPYHLLAMSLGAMVATEWARLAPDDVAGCVLINTSMRPFSRIDQRLRPRNYKRLLSLALFSRDPLASETAVWRLTSHQHHPDPATLAQWVAARAVHPVGRANAFRQLVAAARYRAPRQAPAPRTLLLASEHDGLVHSACSRAIAQAWGCPLWLHPTAGHDLPLDASEWVVHRVCDWLAHSAPAQP